MEQSRLANDDGFSLLEVLIGSGVALVMIMGMATSMNFGVRSVQTVSAATEFNSLVTLIQGLLSNSAACNKALGDNKWNSPLAAAGPINPPWSILPLKTNGNGGNDLVVQGAYGKSLAVQKLGFTYGIPLPGGNGEYVLTLRLEADKLVPGGVVGSDKLSHEFKVLLKIDPGQGNKITGCSANDDGLWHRSANGKDIYFNEGALGIGTDTPTEFIDIRRKTPDYTALKMKNEQGGANATVALWLESDAAVTQLHSDPQAVGGATWLQSNSNLGIRFGAYSPTGEIRFWTGHDWNQPHHMALDNLGRLGIGDNIDPLFPLDVDGDVNIRGAAPGVGLRFNGGLPVCTAAGCTAPSDAKLKTDIQPLSDAEAKIRQLEGVSYLWKDSRTYGEGRQLGVIAQDIEKVFPEVVKTDKTTGQKAVAYTQLIAPLIEAFKANAAKTDALERRLQEVSEKAEKLQRELADVRTEASARAARCSAGSTPASRK